jgi:hypothetical protein
MNIREQEYCSWRVTKIYIVDSSSYVRLNRLTTRKSYPNYWLSFYKHLLANNGIKHWLKLRFVKREINLDFEVELNHYFTKDLVSKNSKCFSPFLPALNRLFTGPLQSEKKTYDFNPIILEFMYDRAYLICILQALKKHFTQTYSSKNMHMYFRHETGRPIRSKTELNSTTFTLVRTSSICWTRDENILKVFTEILPKTYGKNFARRGIYSVVSDSVTPYNFGIYFFVCQRFFGPYLENEQAVVKQGSNVISLQISCTDKGAFNAFSKHVENQIINFSNSFIVFKINEISVNPILGKHKAFLHSKGIFLNLMDIKKGYQIATFTQSAR